MDYNLTKTTEGKIEYNIDQALTYGDMPPGMLMAKFEETDMGPDEDAYDTYVRGVMSNWGPDTNRFEHEEARGGVNRRAGRLQLQYYGHRGDVDTPYRPEWFDGFMGPEDQDPRGINVDPDMKRLVAQEQARMRFIRFTPDGNDSITGGGRSESQVMADQQKLFRVVRNRLKVFDRQIDGRRNGLRREFAHKSNIGKQVLVQSYGDYIKDYAMNPQRRANIICKEILRDSRAWRDQTMDADFAFARYSQICRRARQKPSDHNRVKDMAQDSRKSEFNDDDTAKCYKTAGLLMANIIRGKKQGMELAKTGDMDMAEARMTVARKTEPFARDLALILRSMTQDGDFATGDTTMIVKTAKPQIMDHLARQIVYNHLAPAHLYLNAEILYKSVKPGADTRKIKDQVIRDANAPQLQDMQTVGGKTAKMQMLSGAKLNTAYDADDTESSTTYNYRTALNPNGDKRVRLVANDQSGSESDATQYRRPNHTNYRVASIDDTVEDISYGNNTCKERHTRGLGSKYMNRYIDRDAKGDDLSALN